MKEVHKRSVKRQHMINENFTSRHTFHFSIYTDILSTCEVLCACKFSKKPL